MRGERHHKTIYSWAAYVTVSFNTRLKMGLSRAATIAVVERPPAIVPRGNRKRRLTSEAVCCMRSAPFVGEVLHKADYVIVRRIQKVQSEATVREGQGGMCVFVQIHNFLDTLLRPENSAIHES